MTHDRIDQALRKMPVVAILRGITPEEVLDVGEALVEAGITILEIPFNSPSPIESIALLRDGLSDEVIVGAGTIVSAEQVDAVRSAGGDIVVSPNTDARVIRRCIAKDMLPMPGIGSPTEAFAAIAAGATRLKLFPASVLGTGMLRALRDVVPANISIFAVGGISSANAGSWAESGAAGVGVGSAIFAPGDRPADVFAKARGIVDSVRQERWRE